MNFKEEIERRLQWEKRIGIDSKKTYKGLKLGQMVKAKEKIKGQDYIAQQGEELIIISFPPCTINTGRGNHFLFCKNKNGEMVRAFADEISAK